MSEELSLFRKYRSKDEAEAVVNFLIKNGIDAQLGDNIPVFDITFSGSTAQHEFEIKLKEEHFAKAESILIEEASKEINNIPEDHYLFNFSQEELYDILRKYDEWGELDYNLAIQILRNKGVQIDDSYIHKLKEARISELSKPEKMDTSWIALGYILSLFTVLIGAFYGYYYMHSKKTLPNGKKVYMFTEQDRKRGGIFLKINAIVTILASVTAIIILG